MSLSQIVHVTAQQVMHAGSTLLDFYSKLKGSLQRPSGHTGYKVTMKIQNRLAKEHRWLVKQNRVSQGLIYKSNDKSLSLLQGLLE